MRALRHPVIIVFLALSLAPLALLGIDGPWLGGGGGPALRAPSPFPSGLSAQTFRRVSNWLNDRLGMRFPLMMLDSHWRLRLWQFRFRGDAIFGNDGWLFWTDNPPLPAARMADVRGHLRMAHADIARLDQQMTAAAAKFAACGKNAFVAIAPNKQSIYPERLRDAGGPHAESRLDDVLSKLGPVTRAMFIDPRTELRQSKSSFGTPVYYRTDSHWNDLGAFIAYQAVVKALAASKSIDRPELATLNGANIQVQPYSGGDMAVNILFLPWQFADDRVIVRVAGGEPPLSEKVEGDRVLILNPAGKGRLLMFADSFGGSLARLLARHFNEVELLSRPSWPAVFDGERIAMRKADVAIVEIAERSLPELLQGPRNLQRVCEGG